MLGVRRCFDSMNCLMLVYIPLSSGLRSYYSSILYPKSKKHLLHSWHQARTQAYIVQIIIFFCPIEVVLHVHWYPISYSLGASV